MNWEDSVQRTIYTLANILKLINGGEGVLISSGKGWVRRNGKINVRGGGREVYLAPESIYLTIVNNNCFSKVLLKFTVEDILVDSAFN